MENKNKPGRSNYWYDRAFWYTRRDSNPRHPV